MTEKIKRWDTAEHLRGNDEINTYINSSFADGNERQILHALDNSARAREMLFGDYTAEKKHLPPMTDAEYSALMDEVKAEAVEAGTWE
jgi:hypothetical protein